jgi:hypothetical protein
MLSWLERLQANSLIGRRLRDLAITTGFHAMSERQYPPERKGVHPVNRFRSKEQLFQFISHVERVTQQEYEHYKQGRYTAWLWDVYDYAIAMAPESEAARRAEELMQAIFTEAKQVSKSVGACFVVLIQPSEWDASETGLISYHELDSYSRNFQRGYKRRNLTDIMKRAAIASDVAYIDLYDHFSPPEARAYNPVELDYGDNHWSVSGIELASEVLRSFIKANNCLDITKESVN